MTEQKKPKRHSYGFLRLDVDRGDVKVTSNLGPPSQFFGVLEGKAHIPRPIPLSSGLVRELICGWGLDQQKQAPFLSVVLKSVFFLGDSRMA